MNDDPQSGRTLLIVITADRGLCGSFNTNVAKAALQFTLDQPKDPQGRDVAMALVGRKGRDFFMRRGFDVLYEEVGLFQNVQVVARAGDCADGDQGIPRPRHQLGLPRLQRVPLGDLAARRDRKAAADSAAQRSRSDNGGTRPAASQQDASASPAVDYLFEPDPKQLLNTLLPLHVAVQVQRALLESSAAEHAARMQSMDSATRNAKEMVDRLTLYMNKVRQAAITREIIEVVSGAQAT